MAKTNAKEVTPTMSKTKKGGMGTRQAKPRKQSERAEKRVGLVWPVGRVDRLMKRMRLADRSSRSGAVFMSAFLEYICNELLDIAGQEA